MFPFKSLFGRFKEENGTMLIDGKEAFQVLGFKDITLKISDGSNIKVKSNLISFSTFDAFGCVIMINKGCIKVNKGGNTLLKATLINEMYVIDGHIAVGVINDVASKE